MGNRLKYLKMLFCNHAKWNCDTQIRTIKCVKCGKRAWIDNYKSLYTT